jgi:hypothetical protein
VPLGNFLGTVFTSNAVLTSKHIYFGTNTIFSYAGQTRTVTSIVEDAASDLKILRFGPPVATWARLNLEPAADTGGWAVVQGRGLERGGLVVTGSRTNGWTWGVSQNIRRWGVNRYEGFAAYHPTGGPVLAVAAFDYGAETNECMLSNGDSTGPSFVRTGSGWKLAVVSLGVDPMTFSHAANGAAASNATLYDYSGLYYKDGTNWVYATPTNVPLPCTFAGSRVSMRLDWITNAVPGLAFPADVGLNWEGGGALGSAAAEGVAFTLCATNAGPYTVRSLGIDVTWDAALHLRACVPSSGDYAPGTGRWTLPVLGDGDGATLRATVTVWRASAVNGTNLAAVAAASQPDEVATNNVARVAFTAPPTATVLQLR